LFFFFQAEDGIRDLIVTGVQTCALPIWPGGRSHDKVKFNLATQARRQAGSAFKPFTLATAVSQGVSLLSLWNGPPSLVIDDPRCQTTDPKTGVTGPWDVHNYADESAGTMTLLD